MSLQFVETGFQIFQRANMYHVLIDWQPIRNSHGNYTASSAELEDIPSKLYVYSNQKQAQPFH